MEPIPRKPPRPPFSLFREGIVSIPGSNLVARGRRLRWRPEICDQLAGAAGLSERQTMKMAIVKTPDGAVKQAEVDLSEFEEVCERCLREANGDTEAAQKAALEEIERRGLHEKLMARIFREAKIPS